VELHPALLQRLLRVPVRHLVHRAEALSGRVLAGDADATARYLAFLSSGGSAYPIELLSRAGVDMTTDEPLQLTVDKMNRVMDEIEGMLE
jgi:oligoendopeptidase F